MALPLDGHCIVSLTTLTSVEIRQADLLSVPFPAIAYPQHIVWCSPISRGT
jgi:hypothetical protein